MADGRILFDLSEVFRRVFRSAGGHWRALPFKQGGYVQPGLRKAVVCRFILSDPLPERSFNYLSKRKRDSLCSDGRNSKHSIG